jgi:hypothetical protein
MLRVAEGQAARAVAEPFCGTTLARPVSSRLTPPVFVVELAAQRMRDWQADGEPFRKLLNQNQEIPAEAARVHGYTREILERDGEPPLQVYRAFAEYTGNVPLVSFNLEYDLDEVLKPEWKRLRIAPIGNQGFCALRLAQRLLDPVPAGNCKLQTLRQYYRLPEHGAHTALGGCANSGGFVRKGAPANCGAPRRKRTRITRRRRRPWPGSRLGALGK